VGGCCPFCGEDRSDLRLYVSVEKEIGTCFHCGTGFNGAKFVAANEDISIKAAVKILVGDEEGYHREKEDDRGDKVDIWWPETVEIREAPHAVEYLEGRGIGPEIIDHFSLKYCKVNTRVDDRRFGTRSRIIIPIFDVAGNPVSWQGRDITGRALRYLFPPGFQGAEYLYNVHHISTGVEYLIISEGVFDVFGWWRSGATKAVATFGKKISEVQVDMLRFLKPGVIFLAWDSDATWGKYEFVENYGHLFDVRIVDLGGADADELKKGALFSALKHAKKYDWSDKILSGLLP
jgi:DNA primase